MGLVRPKTELRVTKKRASCEKTSTFVRASLLAGTGKYWNSYEPGLKYLHIISKSATVGFEIYQMILSNIFMTFFYRIQDQKKSEERFICDRDEF